MVDGGTSLATPIAAGIANLRGSFSTTSVGELQRLYAQAGGSNFRDITSGVSGMHLAQRGYDLVTGLGAMIGLYPSQSIAPNSLSVQNGTVVGGVPANVIVFDNHDFVVRSLNRRVILNGSFATTLQNQAPTAVTLSLTGYNTGAAGTLFLYNVSTQNWDSISGNSLGPVSNTQTIPISMISNYVDSFGTVNFQISCQAATGGSSPILLGLDQVSLNVTIVP